MTRRVQINVRLSEYEDKQLSQEADKQGCSKSDLIRKLISKLPEPKDDVSPQTIAKTPGGAYMLK